MKCFCFFLLIFIDSGGPCNFPRSWLLPVLKDNVKDTELKYFFDAMLPLAANLRTKGSLAGNNEAATYKAKAQTRETQSVERAQSSREGVYLFLARCRFFLRRLRSFLPLNYIFIANNRLFCCVLKRFTSLKLHQLEAHQFYNNSARMLIRHSYISEI